jgi:hypothetical protein
MALPSLHERREGVLEDPLARVGQVRRGFGGRRGAQARAELSIDLDEAQERCRHDAAVSHLEQRRHLLVELLVQGAVGGEAHHLALFPAVHVEAAPLGERRIEDTQTDQAASAGEPDRGAVSLVLVHRGRAHGAEAVHHDAESPVEGTGRAGVDGVGIVVTELADADLPSVRTSIDLVGEAAARHSRLRIQVTQEPEGPANVTHVVREAGLGDQAMGKDARCGDADSRGGGEAPAPAEADLQIPAREVLIDQPHDDAQVVGRGVPGPLALGPALDALGEEDLARLV